MIFINKKGKLAEPEPPIICGKDILLELTKEIFNENLQNNKGLFIIKFGAEWCGPCKKIDPLVNDWFTKIQGPRVQCAMIDIDESFDIYAFLKSKKMVNGIPVILCYERGNISYVPDDVIIGADENQVNAFFERCFQKLRNLPKEEDELIVEDL